MIRDPKVLAEQQAAKDAAERILRASGYFRTIEMTWGFCPVTFEGQLTSGHYVYFKARGHWIAIEISDDKDHDRPVLTIVQKYDNPAADEVEAEVGAGGMNTSAAAEVLKTRLTRVMSQLLRMNDTKASKLPFFRVTVKDRENRNNRMEVARACLALGVDVVTVDGPDKSVIITCQPIHAFNVCTAVIAEVESTVPYEPKN